MIEPSALRLTKMPLNNGAGYMPAFGFRTLIPDTDLTKTATRDARRTYFDTSIVRSDIGTEREAVILAASSCSRNGNARRFRSRVRTSDMELQVIWISSFT